MTSTNMFLGSSADPAIVPWEAMETGRPRQVSPRGAWWAACWIALAVAFAAVWIYAWGIA